MTEKNTFHRHNHEDRDDLAGEHRLNDMIQVIFFFVFFAVWILDSFVFKFSMKPVTTVSLTLKIIVSVMIFIAAWYLISSGLKTVFGQVRTNPAVIDKGVFKLVRHPVYLGTILCYFPFILNSFSQAAGFIWLLICIYYYFSARYEEKLLIEKFDPEYLAYIKHVPMFIPGFRK